MFMEHQIDDTISGLTTALESKVYSVRNNDPHTFYLCISNGLDPRAWKQLGRFLHKNMHVKYFCLFSCHLKGKSMVGLCTGLEHNESIGEFEISGCQLQNIELRSLAPFIRKNPSLHTLNIEGCLRAPAGGMDLLSSALMGRTQSLENVSLDSNFMGNEQSKDTFDTLIIALNNNRELARCSLMSNLIGKSGCKSLARLLKNPDSKLKSLILRHNCIDDECAGIIAESLTGNTVLNNIDFDRNQIKDKGLMKFLDVISKTPCAPIQLTTRWKYPNSSERSATTTIKINQPLHYILLELSANPHFCWASDISNVKLLARNVRSTLSRYLDCSETPFFYGMQEGDVIEAIHNNEEVYATQTVSNANRGGHSCIRDTIASNHTLSSLGYETAMHGNFIHGSLLREFLEANKKTDKRLTIRVKIFRRHIQDNIILDDFCEMDAVMHRVLAWILHGLGDTDDERTFLTVPPSHIVRLEAIYRILRGMPMLCGF